MKFKQTVLLGAAMAGLLASSAASAAEEQFIGRDFLSHVI